MQEFAWGMLTLNKSKSNFAKGESVHFFAEVATEGGTADCTSQLYLKLTKPDLTDDIITLQSNCAQGTTTLKPSYQASYVPRQIGEYTVVLSSEGDSGSHTVSDTFTVGENESFDIQRNSKTHIYNDNEGVMDVTITAHTDFSGTIVETVPADLEILPGSDNRSYDAITTIKNVESDPTILSTLLIDKSLLQKPFDGNFKVSQGFGTQSTEVPLLEYYSNLGLQGHDGVDFALPLNTPVYTVDDGIVLFAGPGDYGNTVVIQHAWGRSYYGHLSQITTSAGVSVLKGMHVGLSGTSGDSTGPHLHLGLKPNRSDAGNGYGGKVDPLQYVPDTFSEISQVLGERIVNASDSGELEELASESAKQVNDVPVLPTPTGIAPESEDATENTATTSADIQQQVDTQVKTHLKEKQPLVQQNVKLIKWTVDMRKGEKMQLQYRYKIPRIFPVTYSFGTIKLFANTTKDIIYSEKTVWYVTGQKLEKLWADSAWQSRKEIVIDHTTVGLAGIDTSSDGQFGESVASLSWKHTVHQNENRLLVVGINTRGKNVNNVVFGKTPLVQLIEKNCGSDNCHNEIWYVINPVVGTETVTVVMDGVDDVTAGSTSLYDVSPSDSFGAIALSASDPESKASEGKEANNKVHYILGHGGIANQDELTTGFWKANEVYAGATMNQFLLGDADIIVSVNPYVQPSQTLLVPLPTAVKKQLLTDESGKELPYRMVSSKKKIDPLFAWVSVTGLDEKKDTHLYLYTDYLSTTTDK